jgi:multiple sugar transport system ATP-binding protein
MNFYEGRIEQKSGGIWFSEGNFTIRVEDSQAARLGSRVGQAIVFGARPEDVQDVLYVTNPNPEHQLKARVEVVEPMGAEVYIYLNTGKHTFIARVDVRDNADVNQQLTMALNMKKAHFFDPKSGETIV